MSDGIFSKFMKMSKSVLLKQKARVKIITA